MRYSRRTLLIVTVLFVVLLGAGAAFAAEPVALELDGELVEIDPNAPPIIEDGRTLVPYRALLEAMGATVLWDDDARMATAELGRHRVKVTIDNKSGFVDGREETMDVPPRIVNSRTMIPVRFVLENLNCSIDWEATTRTVKIGSAPQEDCSVIQSVKVEEMEEGYRVTALSDQPIATTKTFAYEAPERFGIDIEHALLLGENGAVDGENEIFQGVRYAQFDEGTVRLVVDLKDKVAGKISLSEDRHALYIDFEKLKAPVESEDPVNRGESDLRGERIPELHWTMTGKLVAIDVGHGGRDPGAEGKLSGVHKIYEKDLNLAIALRLREILRGAGANMVLLRDTDTYISLYERPEKANLMNADMLISIHNNAHTNSAAHGIVTLYYNKKSEAGYDVSSGSLAHAIHAEMVKEIGFYNRRIEECPEYAVLNKSDMPAVILEGGFLTNPDNLKFMLTDAFVEAYATAVARGVILSLNASVTGE